MENPYSQLKPGDRVIWLRSPGRSILSGWRVEEVTGIVERLCKQRIRIRVRMEGKDKIVSVDPDNLTRAKYQSSSCGVPNMGRPPRE
jgi:flagellar biosynthesis/type III secretory pathway M-ring protein FliF/YscJ